MNKGISIYEKEGFRVVKGNGYYVPSTINNLRELVKGSAARYADKVAFKYKNGNGSIITKSYKQLDNDVDCLGTALIDLGLMGEKIAVIGENRYDWSVSYLSIVNGTGIAVPMDKYLPKIEVQNLVKRAKVKAIFFTDAYFDMMKSISAEDTTIQYFICMDKIVSFNSDRFISYIDLIEKGKKLILDGNRSFTDALININALSVLLFTSGTTSMSKGVMLSHANIASNVSAITTMIKIYPDDVHLSLLPLHHTFENSIGLLFMLHSGVCIAYCDGIKYIAQNIHEYGVTILVAIPAIFDAMYKRLNEGIEKSGKAKLVSILGKVSDSLLAIGIDVRRKLFKSVLEKLGPRLRLAVSGAAPLDAEVIKGFGRLGFNIIQGYGLTETSPVVAANNDFVNVPGTVGYPLAGIEVAIDKPDENGMGEIITRGKNVMLGYFENEEATNEALDNGWFRTGDLGTIDNEGLIRITGRAKSMIVFTNGKKAFPEEYEMLLNIIPGVKDSFAWGNKAADGDVQICVKIVIDKEIYSNLQKNKDNVKEISELFLSKIKEINTSLPQYKIIRYFILTYDDLIKTTTLKIKRREEQDKIKALLDKMGIDMRKASGKIV